MGRRLFLSVFLWLGFSLIITAQNLASQPLCCAKTGLVLSGQGQKTKKAQKRERWLTALYLRQDNGSRPNRSDWPLVPALMLETTPSLAVKTREGPKIVGNLKKGDVLYRYEPDTQKISAWKVGIVQRKARRVSTRYAQVIEENSGLLENRVALDR